jgi:hypothetical protein
MHSSIGYTATRDAVNPSTAAKVGIKDEMRSGLGTAWPAAGMKVFNGALQGLFEYSTITYVGAGSTNPSSSLQNASDIAAGVRYLMLDRGVTLNAGFRINTKFDLSLLPPGADRRGFTFSVAYTKPVRPPGNNRFPVVALESSADQVRVGGSAVITATGYDADNDPLTYSWSASGGQIAGSGEKVTFNATGIQPGKVTIRVTASDGKGGTATSLIDLAITP